MHFCRPFHGLGLFSADDPSTEVLGYYRSSAPRTALLTAFMNNAGQPGLFTNWPFGGEPAKQATAWCVRKDLSPTPWADDVCGCFPWGLRPRLYAFACSAGFMMMTFMNNAG